MTHKWNYLPITSEQTEASQRLAQELGISPILGELLVERGITTAAAAKKFFRPQLPDLYDPFLMKDMDVAVERLNKAMGKKERDRKSTRLNSSHIEESRMPSSA